MGRSSKVKKEEEHGQQPSNEVLRSHIRRLIPTVDLQNTGVKAFTKLLSKECGGADLKSRSKFIKQALTEAINEMESSSNSSSSEDEESDDDEDSIITESKKKKKNQKKNEKPRATGLTVKKEITAELAYFLGKKPTEQVARTDIVKIMWDYIKEHELQNPDNKREIYLDDKMKDLFGVDHFNMFTMNKYISAHVFPYKPVDLTEPSDSTKEKKKKKKEAAVASKRGQKLSKHNNGDDDGKSKKPRKPKKPGLQPPYRLSKELTDVVQTDILPRPQVVKAIWMYIKKHDLQDPQDKRTILCDKKLKKVMGGNDEVTMFNMNKFVSNHLFEKLGKSEYSHEAEL